MDADALLGLLGRTADDSAVEAALQELRTRRRPQLDPTDRDAVMDWVLVRRQGVEFGFVDDVFYHAGPKSHRRRPGVPLRLWQLYFYTQREDVSDFKGQLPFHLAWSDTRENARLKMKPLQHTLRPYAKDVWDAPEFRVVLEYKEEGTLDNVLCERPLRPWPEEGRRQPVLTIADWMALFGIPAGSEALRQKLQPLDFARRLEDSEPHEVEFLFECGLELYFAKAGDLKLKERPVPVRKTDRVFAAVQFFRSREMDARQWAGPLPFGLSFDDTQASLFEKMREKPVEHEDEKFSGYARWKFPEAEVRVQYSNVENHLLSVSLQAPGYA